MNYFSRVFTVSMTVIFFTGTVVMALALPPSIAAKPIMRKTLVMQSAKDQPEGITASVSRPVIPSAAIETLAVQQGVLVSGSGVPLALSHYGASQPASVSPLLVWNKNIDAVYYEIEFFDRLPDNLSNREISPDHIFFSAQVYTNAYNPRLDEFAAADIGTKPLYWRVRAMNLDKTAQTSFSVPEPLYTDSRLPIVNAPIPNITYNNERGEVLLYPVYSWIPNYGARKFEVEVLSAPPENPNGTTPSKYRIATLKTNICEVYDDVPRSGLDHFFWRVRGFAEDGSPVGTYSAARAFLTNPNEKWEAAIYGDSISHGGGHISFGPADWEYSYSCYLNFKTVNLSQSGDTSSSMVERFNRDVPQFHPQYLLIMGGSNSLRGGATVDGVIADLKALQLKCLENNIKPIFLTLPPINPANIKKAFDEDTVEDWQDRFMAVNDFIRNNLVHIDVAAQFNSNDGLLPTKYGLDGLHLDVPGKKIMAQLINGAWPYILQEADLQQPLGSDTY